MRLDAPFTQAEVLNNYQLYYSGVNFSPMNTTNGEMYWNALNMVNELAIADYDFRNLQNTGASENVTLYMKKLLDGIDASYDLNSIKASIDGTMTEANANLTDLDLDIITGACIVAKASATLWAPVSQGGLGYADQYISPTQRSGWFGKMILGDVSGSAGYFATLGWGAALGWGVPGANVALLGGWAMSAGLASACALGGFYSVPIPPSPPLLLYDPNNAFLIFNFETTGNP